MTRTTNSTHTHHTSIVKKVAYSMLASTLVLGLSPASFALAETAADAAASVASVSTANAQDIVASTTFTFSDSSIAASGQEGGYEIEGTTLTIKSAGVYEVTGSCAQGQIVVKKATTDVTIIFNDLTLANDGDKAVKLKENAEATILLRGTNNLSTDNDKGIIKSNGDGQGGGSLTIDGSGTLNLSSSWTGTEVDEDTGESEEAACDGINGEGNVTILGGTYNIDVTDDGIHADYILTIGTEGSWDGPSITIKNAEEGLEGATVNLHSGTADITTSDDGINAANKDLWTSANNSYEYAINITGGVWTVNAEGDGLDSNGNITISGGTTVVYGSTKGGNGALDYGEGAEGEIKGNFVHTGGTLLAVGTDMLATPTSGNYVVFGSGAGMGGMGGGMPGNASGGMQGGPGMRTMSADGEQSADSASADSQSTAFSVQRFGGASGNSSIRRGAAQGGISVSAGQVLSIKDASGNEVYSATAAKGGSYVVFASNDLSTDGSYTLYIDSSEAASATVGAASMQQPGNGQQPGPQQGTGSQNQSQNGQQQPGQDQQPPSNANGSGADGSMPAPPNTGNGTDRPEPPADGQLPADGQAPADGTTPADGQGTAGGQAPADQAQTDGQQGANSDTSATGTDGGSQDEPDSQEATRTVTSVDEAGAELEVGDTVTAGSDTSKASYTIVSLADANTSGTVTYTKAKVSSRASKATVPASVKIDGKTYKVTGIGAKAFKSTKVKTVTVKTKNLTKKSVTDSLKGSKVSTIKVSTGSKKANKKLVKAYTKIFKKTNSGKKVNVK